MADWATILGLAGPSLQAVGGALKGESENEKLAKYKRKRFEQLAPGLESDLSQGITDADLVKIGELIRRSAMPLVNSFAGRAAGRFGSRSGRVAGAAVAGINQGLTGPLANVAAQAQQFNLGLKRYLHSAYST